MAYRVSLNGDIVGDPENNAVHSVSGSSNLITINASSLQFANGVSAPIIDQAVLTTDVAPQNLTIQPQAPYASATTNKSAGNIKFNIPSSVSGSSTGYAEVQYGGTNIWSLGAYQGNSSFAALYGPVTPGASNFAFLATSSVTEINVPSGGTIDFDINNVVQMAITTTGLQVSPGGTNTIYLQELVSNAGTGALYLNPVTPSSANYTLLGGSTTTQLNVPTSGILYFNVNNSAVTTISATTHISYVNMVPNTTNTLGLGTSGAQWGNLYTTGLSSTSTAVTINEPITFKTIIFNDGYSGAVTTGATLTTIYTGGAMAASTSYDYVVSVFGINTSNQDTYRADFAFTYSRVSTASPVAVGASAVPLNIRTSGAANTWGGASISLSSNSPIVQVTGLASTTIDWSCSFNQTTIS